MRRSTLCLSLLVGFVTSVILVVAPATAQPIATEEDFDPYYFDSEFYRDKEPWVRCTDWFHIDADDEARKAASTACYEERSACLEVRRHFYLDEDGGWHRAARCYRACDDACTAASGGGYCASIRCDRARFDYEVAYCSCKAGCSLAEEERALPDCGGDLRTCCLALEQVPSSGRGDAPKCDDGVQNGDEEGVDCGGDCDAPCTGEVALSISPSEVEMVADGQTELVFTVTVTEDGAPLADQEVGFHLEDERRLVEDDREGTVTPSAARTDARGQLTLTYRTAEQPRDFAGATMVLQAVHPNGNPAARIVLTPGLSLWCGNWVCQTGETHERCPEDCPRTLTEQEAWSILLERYRGLPLNPYARQGVWCASCPTNNRVLVAMTYETFSSDAETLAYAKRLKDQYEPWVCGSHQARTITMLDELRLSRDATEREVISRYIDYGPIEVLAPPVLNPLAGHLAVVVYPKGTLWQDTAKVLDIWLTNAHGVYGIGEWEAEVHGQARGFQCDTAPFSPVCGGDYERVLRPEYALTPEEQAYYDGLSTEIRSRIDASIGERARMDARDAQRKYLIGKMRAFDASEKVRIVVLCPLNVLLTNAETGARVGYDATGRLLVEDPAVYPEIREFASGESISFFSVPAAVTYTVTAAGTGDGTATILTSRPTADGQFQIRAYEGAPVREGSTLSLALDPTEPDAPLDVDGRSIAPTLREVGVTFDALDPILALAASSVPRALDAPDGVPRSLRDLVAWVASDTARTAVGVAALGGFLAVVMLLLQLATRRRWPTVLALGSLALVALSLGSLLLPEAPQQPGHPSMMPFTPPSARVDAPASRAPSTTLLAASTTPRTLLPSPPPLSAPVGPTVAWSDASLTETYENCLYWYQLRYPGTWEVTGATQSSDAVTFSGDGVTVSVTSEPLEGATVDAAVDARAARITGSLVDTRDKLRNGARFLAREYEEPPSTHVFWEREHALIELAVTGDGMESFIVGTSFFSWLNMNPDALPTCGG